MWSFPDFPKKICILRIPTTVETPSPTEEPLYSVLDTYSGFVDGIERTLLLIKNDWLEIGAVLEIENTTSGYAYCDFDLVTAGFDKYGCIEILTNDNMVIGGAMISPLYKFKRVLCRAQCS